MSKSSEAIAGDDALASALVRDIARRQIGATQAAAAQPQDGGRSLPLPMPEIGALTIGEALRAAVFQLDELERKLGHPSGDTGSDEPDGLPERSMPAHIADAARRDR